MAGVAKEEPVSVRNGLETVEVEIFF